MRLKTDLVEICEAILSQTLSNLKIEWHAENSACVVLAAKGYPQKPQTGDVISGLDNLKNRDDVQVFHAGTAKNGNGEFITAGGRVLGITAMAENLNEALQKAYQTVGEISFDGMQYRKDIGK